MSPRTLLFALLLATGCSGDHADHADHAGHADHAAAPADHAGHAAAPAAAHSKAGEHAAPALMLNEGGKWSLDESTRTTSAALNARLSEATPESLPAMTALGAALQADLDGLIAGCTMTGPAHDQLHVFLMAFIPEVQALSATTDVAAGNKHLERLRGLMTSYDEHFE